MSRVSAIMRSYIYEHFGNENEGDKDPLELEEEPSEANMEVIHEC